MQNRRHRTPHASTRLAAQSRVKPFLIILGILFVGVYLFNRTDTTDTKSAAVSESKVAGTQTKAVKPTQAAFPTLDTSSFTPAQQRMLAIIKTEYAKQPTSYDKTVLTYTEGFKESWCADFISWVRFQADKPFVNPETGYWRIPGAQSLRDYYDSTDAYHQVGSYTPKFGDVAFYFGETPDGTNREHVAFVLQVKGDTLVTLGGNETSKGVLQLRSNKLVEGERGLSGFGESNL